jgi:hypothetical protein
VSNFGSYPPAGYTPPTPVHDASTAAQARRDARTTHALQLAQLIETYLVYQQTRRAAAAQEQAAAVAQRHADAHMNYLWSQYLQSDAGSEYALWAEKAEQAVRLRSLYDQLWVTTWQDAVEDLQGPTPRWSSSPRPKSRWWWVLLCASGTFFVSLFLLVIWASVQDNTYIEDRPLYAQVLGWLVLLSALASVGSLVAAAIHQWAIRERLLTRDQAGAAALLEDRRRQRVAAFGHDVFAAHVERGTLNVTAQLTLPWTLEPADRSNATAVFNTQAFTTYPMPHLLPWDLTTIEQPRQPAPAFPSGVNDLLNCFVGGEVDEAAPAAEQRLARRFPQAMQPGG